MPLRTTVRILFATAAVLGGCAVSGIAGDDPASMVADVILPPAGLDDHPAHAAVRDQHVAPPAQDDKRLAFRQHAEIEDGQKSTLLCHLGNIAWRTGHTINFDPQSRRILADDTAAALTTRAYRPGWEPKV